MTRLTYIPMLLTALLMLMNGCSPSSSQPVTDHTEQDIKATVSPLETRVSELEKELRQQEYRSALSPVDLEESTDWETGLFLDGLATLSYPKMLKIIGDEPEYALFLGKLGDDIVTLSLSVSKYVTPLKIALDGDSQRQDAQQEQISWFEENIRGLNTKNELISDFDVQFLGIQKIASYESLVWYLTYQEDFGSKGVAPAIEAEVEFLCGDFSCTTNYTRYSQDSSLDEVDWAVVGYFMDAIRIHHRRQENGN